MKNTEDPYLVDRITVYLKGALLTPGDSRLTYVNYPGELYSGIQILEGVLYVNPIRGAGAGFKIYAPGNWCHVDVQAKPNPNYLPQTVGAVMGSN